MRGGWRPCLCLLAAALVGCSSASEGDGGAAGIDSVVGGRAETGGIGGTDLGADPGDPAGGVDVGEPATSDAVPTGDDGGPAGGADGGVSSESDSTATGADADRALGDGATGPEEPSGEPCDVAGEPCASCTCYPDGSVFCAPVAVGTPCGADDCCVTGATCQPCLAGAADCPVSGLSCQGPVWKSCDDDNSCTSDAATCVSNSCVCAHTLEQDGATCELETPGCTEAPTCQLGKCVAGPVLALDDGNPCTEDVCVDGGVVHQVGSWPCDDGDPCTLGDTCTLGQCVPKQLQPCPGGPCVGAAWCDSLTGQCQQEALPDGALCDLDDPCVLAASCQAGVCEAAVGVACDDGNPCTLDGCESSAGGCEHANVADGTPCQADKLCIAGECVEVPALTAPEVSIEPAQPGPGDALACVLVQDSVAEDGSEVTYTYQWIGPDGDAGVSADALPAGLTGACEAWICRATPSTPTLGVGPPGAASTLVLGDECEGCPLPSDVDGDGLLDPDDNCPELHNPDQQDADGDGIGDLCDDCWLDGPTALELPATISPAGVIINNASVNGGGPTATGIAPGATFTLALDWQVVGFSCDYCPGCVTQYIVGISTGQPCTHEHGSDKLCLYSGGSGCSGGSAGSTSDVMTAPEVPGMYFLRANYTWHYSCPEGETVFKHPGMANSLAAICVQ